METNNDHGKLRLEVEFDRGLGEISVRPDHPLVAAFRRGMEEGQPVWDWRYLIISEESLVPLRLFGTFTRTATGRVLFFPGGSVRLIAKGQFERFNNVRLDHVTLDPPKGDGYSSHITVVDKKPNPSGASRRGRVLPGYMFPWFSMLLRGFDRMVQLPAKLSVSFAKREWDSEAYGSRLMGNGAIAYMPVPRANIIATSFLQFDVWVGHGLGWQERKADVMPWAFKPEVVTNGPTSQEVHGVETNIPFSDECGLRVLACQPFGHLMEEGLLRAGFDPRRVKKSGA